MDGVCAQPSKRTLRANGCSLLQESIPWNGSGSKSTPRSRKGEPGLPMRIGWKQQNCIIRLMSLSASAATKRSTHWIGYKAHFTETCDEDLPRLITQVTT